MASNRLYGPNGPSGTAGTVPLNTPGAAAAVLPATQIVTGTTETVIVNPSNPTTALVLTIPSGGATGTGPLEAQRFTLEASGYISTGASSTVTLKLYDGTSTTVGSDTLLGSSGAITAFSAKVPYWVTASMIYDSVSGKLNGKIEFMVNNTLVAAVALSNVVTALTSAGNPVTNFVLSVTFGTANAANTIFVKDFCINF